jgi:hypothetical protein
MPRDTRTELAVFLAVAAFTYLSIHRDLSDPNHGNEWSRAALTFAVVEHGTLSIDPYAGRTEDWSRHAGHYYSNKAPGPALLAVPVYFAQHRIQQALGIADDAPRARNVALYLATAVSTVLPTLAALALLYLVLVRRYALAPLAAFAVCGAWGAGSLALVYGTLFFGHQSAAAFFAIGMALSLLEPDGLDGESRPGRLWLAGLAMGLAVASDFIAAPLVAWWSLWVAWRARRRPRLIAAWVLGGLGPALALMALNRACFGGVFVTAYNDAVINPHWRALNTLEAPDLGRLADITIRPWRGLLYCAPVWALVAVGIDRLRSEARARPELWVAAAALVAQLIYMSALPSAFGGFCVGPRYATALLPLAALLLAPAVRLVPRLFVALAALSAFMMLVACLTDPLPGDGYRDPYREVLFPMLAREAHGPQLSLLRDGFGLSLHQTLFAYLALWLTTALWLRHRLKATPSTAV